jgi:hypothetical protein
MSLVSNPTGGSTIGVELSQEIQPGILVALSAFEQDPSDIQFDVFVAIGIKSQTQQLNGRRVQLAEGYLRQQAGITWTGFYPIATGDRMYMFIKGISTSPIELSERRLTAETQIIPGVTLAQLLRTT